MWLVVRNADFELGRKSGVMFAISLLSWPNWELSENFASRILERSIWPPALIYLRLICWTKVMLRWKS